MKIYYTIHVIQPLIIVSLYYLFKGSDHKVNPIFKSSHNIPPFLPSTKAKTKMAGGAFVSEGGSGGRDYEGGVTVFVVITCMVAAMGGLLFGYDLGISGGVTSMDEFLSKFFPQLEKQRVKAKHETAYCKFDDQKLQLFTSSLYLAALVASFVASVVTRKYGRKVSMFTGGLAFLTGALINAFAINVTMLIIGRLLLGVGVGFANQVRS